MGKKRRSQHLLFFFKVVVLAVRKKSWSYSTVTPLANVQAPHAHVVEKSWLRHCLVCWGYLSSSGQEAHGRYYRVFLISYKMHQSAKLFRSKTKQQCQNSKSLLKSGFNSQNLQIVTKYL